MRRLPQRRNAAPVLLLALGLSLLPSAGGIAVSAESPLERIERIADGVDFDWRGHGVTFHIACPDDLDDCPAAAYETATRRILIAERSLEDPGYLSYLVLHELAHAWQFTERGWRTAQLDLVRWGRHGLDGLEAGADCIAAVWGAERTHHWTCPTEAATHLRTSAGVPALTGSMP